MNFTTWKCHTLFSVHVSTYAKYAEIISLYSLSQSILLRKNWLMYHIKTKEYIPSCTSFTIFILLSLMAFFLLHFTFFFQNGEPFDVHAAKDLIKRKPYTQLNQCLSLPNNKFDQMTSKVCMELVAKKLSYVNMLRLLVSNLSSMCH